MIDAVATKVMYQTRGRDNEVKGCAYQKWQTCGEH